jgi:hypothetical protein
MERPPSGRELRVAQIRAPEEARVGCVDHAVGGERSFPIVWLSCTVPYLDVRAMMASGTERTCMTRGWIQM